MRAGLTYALGQSLEDIGNPPVRDDQVALPLGVARVGRGQLGRGIVIRLKSKLRPGKRSSRPLAPWLAVATLSERRKARNRPTTIRRTKPTSTSGCCRYGAMPAKPAAGSYAMTVLVGTGEAEERCEYVVYGFSHLLPRW